MARHSRTLTRREPQTIERDNRRQIAFAWVPIGVGTVQIESHRTEAVFESPESGDATSHSQLKLFGEARTLGRQLPTDKDFEDEELSNAIHNRSCSNDNPQVQTCGQSAPVTAGGSPIFPSRRMHARESTV